MKHPSGLLIMPGPLRTEFRRTVSAARIKWTYAETCREAREALSHHPDFAVVISEATLPDGNWYCVLDELTRRGSAANLIVVLSNGTKDDVIEQYDVQGVLRRPISESAVDVIEAAVHQPVDRIQSVSKRKCSAAS